MEVSRIKDLYYVLMKNKLGNHKICKTLIRHGEIRVNDQVITDVRYPVKADDIIMYHHIQLNAQPFVYYMMNKPADYLCANHDKYHQCVIDLIGRDGVVIDHKVQCLPSLLEILDEYHCLVTINEGRYHQIKKMFKSCQNEVCTLKRIAFAGIELDQKLALGEYRDLTSTELITLFKHC